MIEQMANERDLAIKMLAEWAVAVDEVDATWDSWDDYYKEVMYGNNAIRHLLDEAIEKAREFYKEDM